MFEIQAEINKHTKKQKNVSNHQRANQKKKKNKVTEIMGPLHKYLKTSVYIYVYV